MKIAAYARSATSPNRAVLEEPAIQNQLSEIDAWAQKNLHDVTDVFAEITGGFPNRGAEFTKMLNNAVSDEHPYDAIAVRDYARISREIPQLMELKMLLEKDYQVRIISIECEAHPIPPMDR